MDRWALAELHTLVGATRPPGPDTALARSEHRDRVTDDVLATTYTEGGPSWPDANPGQGRRRTGGSVAGRLIHN